MGVIEDVVTECAFVIIREGRNVNTHIKIARKEVIDIGRSGDTI